MLITDDMVMATVLIVDRGYPRLPYETGIEGLALIVDLIQ